MNPELLPGKADNRHAPGHLEEPELRQPHHVLPQVDVDKINKYLIQTKIRKSMQ